MSEMLKMPGHSANQAFHQLTVFSTSTPTHKCYDWPIALALLTPEYSTVLSEMYRANTLC